MAKLGRVSDAARLRARRWEVIVLGSGLSGLVAAARLSAANHSVLVVEEDAARAQHPALREPFLLSGLRDEGVLYHTLRNLNIPLIDRRRLQAERLAYQVVSPKWRVDVGAAKHMPAELEAWGPRLPIQLACAWLLRRPLATWETPLDRRGVRLEAVVGR